MTTERLRRRLELRQSNAATPHRNLYREAKTGQAPWNVDDFHDWCCAEENNDD
ncbi:MAG: hypothetical protein K0U84_24875 [Actinomycetia bacterium]|nr:hypothetical protein [Actinomycetes bacterium]